MKKLLVIGHQWAEPNSSAAGTRMMQLLSLFQELQYTITFVCAAHRSVWAAPLEAMGIETQQILLNDSCFDVWLRELDPSVVLFDRFLSEEQYGWRVSTHCPQAIRVLDTEDLHFLRQAREKSVHDGVEWSENLFTSSQVYREIASIYRCDLTLLVSKFEYQLLQDIFQIDLNLLYYLPLWINQEQLWQTNKTPTFDERKDFCFLGNFLHKPNWDAVLQLKQHIWPLLRKAVPEASLQIYGAYASQKVNDLHQPKDRFFVCGRIDQALETLSNHRVLLAPIRFGAGIKGKFLDAMQSGTPSVTTEIGAEGMTNDEIWSGFIVNKTEDFVEKSVELYQNQNTWQTAQKNGKIILQEHFHSVDHVLPFMHFMTSFEKNYLYARKKNFIGNLLHHHQFQSSKYMSLWIEEKAKQTKLKQDI